MTINVDLTPHRVRVIPNSDSIRNMTPINSVGTAISLELSNDDYRYFIRDKPEEAIIYTIFERNKPEHIDLVVKVRWDNNTTEYLPSGRILLLSTVVPMSASIWGPPKQLFRAPKDHDIAKINRRLNKTRKDLGIGIDFGSLDTLTCNNDKTEWYTNTSFDAAQVEAVYTGIMETLPAEGIVPDQSMSDRVRARKYSKVSDLAMAEQIEAVKVRMEEHGAINEPNINPFEIHYDGATKQEKLYIDVGRAENGDFFYTTTKPVKTERKPLKKRAKSSMNTRSWTSNISTTTSYTDTW